MQTQTSNTLHNDIMETSGKDCPPMLAPDNYVQWKSRIKRYIDTKPNHELIHYCLKNPPYKYQWADKDVPVADCLPMLAPDNYVQWKSRIKRYIDTKPNHELIHYCLKNPPYKYQWADKDVPVAEVNEIRAERLARTANPLALVAQQQPIYHPQNHPTHYTQNSLTRTQQAATRNKGKAIVNSPPLIYDQEPSLVTDDDEMSKDKEKSRIQCYNCKEFGHVARECQKLKRAKDAAYHKEKMLLCKQEEVGFQLNAEQANWKDDIDDEPEDQELEAHYMHMAQIQEVTLDAADNSGPIFDSAPLQKVPNDDHYNVFAIESKHP
nr:hypothetical protein [Tanacetum cinerariifolium]